MEEIAEQLREPAARAVKFDLALRAVASAEGLEPSDAEVDADIERAAAIPEADGATPDELRAGLVETGQLSSSAGRPGQERRPEVAAGPVCAGRARRRGHRPRGPGAPEGPDDDPEAPELPEDTDDDPEAPESDAGEATDEEQEDS